MNRWRTALVVITLFAVTISACDVKNTSKENYKIGFVSNTYGIDDQYFNQAFMEEGLSKFAKEENIFVKKEYQKIDSTSEYKLEKNLRKLAKKDYQLIFGTGYNIDYAVNSVSKKYKHTNFAIIDSKVYQPNTVSILFKENEGSFLAGVIAAMKTKTKKVGFIGGSNNDSINRFKYGFLAGVKMTDQHIEVFTKNANTYEQPKIGTKIAANLFNQGADIIFQAAGSTGIGVFKEAKNRKKELKQDVWVIGVDQDQYQQGLPENVTLISVVKRFDKVVYDVTKQSKNHQFQGGKTLLYGLNEDGIKLVKAKNNIEDRILKKVNLYKDQIQEGKLTVPGTEEEYRQFEKSL